MAIALTTSTAFTEGSLKVKVLNFVELKTNFSRIFGTKNRKANAAQAGHMDGLPSCLKRMEEEAVRHGQAIAAMPEAYETFRHFVEFEVALTSFQVAFTNTPLCAIFALYSRCFGQMLLSF